jgi:hypothetical protein
MRPGAPMSWLRLLHAIGTLPTRLAALRREVESARIALGRHEARRVRNASFGRLADAEFQVFSQWGEDGIIQYLLGKVPIENDVFVEFGVEDYSESNTRFLLANDRWRGLLIDGGSEHRRFLSEHGLDWRHDVRAVSAFITKENIDALITEAGFAGDIGLLSIDIDGNDYWVLDAIRCVSPRILVVEYNSVFGPELEVTIPYRSDFQRTLAHHSNLYFGASLAALCALAKRKGYAFVGSNSAGSNAFFVRRDVAGALRELTAAEGYVASRFRESRAEDGRLTLVSSHAERLRLVSHLPLVDLRSGRERTISELFSP